jgi:hypothetical protein
MALLGHFADHKGDQFLMELAAKGQKEDLNEPAVLLRRRGPLSFLPDLSKNRDH